MLCSPHCPTDKTPSTHASSESVSLSLSCQHASFSLRHQCLFLSHTNRAILRFWGFQYVFAQRPYVEPPASCKLNSPRQVLHVTFCANFHTHVALQAASVGYFEAPLPCLRFLDYPYGRGSVQAWCGHSHSWLYQGRFDIPSVPLGSNGQTRYHFESTSMLFVH